MRRGCGGTPLPTSTSTPPSAGSSLDLTAVPALNLLLEQVAQKVRDPASGLTRRRAQSRAPRRRGADALINNRIGGGSDYTVFLNFLGVPVADLSFDGPYGVYHSIYDTHRWVATNADPEFRYHAALVELWGLTALTARRSGRAAARLRALRRSAR